MLIRNPKYEKFNYSYHPIISYSGSIGAILVIFSFFKSYFGASGVKMYYFYIYIINIVGICIMNIKSYRPFLWVLVAVCSIISCIERNNKMNSYKEKNDGFFYAQDKYGQDVLIEWYIADILSPRLAEFKREVSELESQVTAVTECQFLQVHPDAVYSGGFLQNCLPLFAQGIEFVAWDKVEQTLCSSIKRFYRADISLFGSEIINKLAEDIYFFASIKDKKTEQVVAFLMAAITPALPSGDIKLINLIAEPKQQDCELQKLLLAALIKVLPQVKRIFTMIRPTSKHEQNMFAGCGFILDTSPVQDPHHPIDQKNIVVLEYKTNRSDILQSAAAKLRS